MPEPLPNGGIVLVEKGDLDVVKRIELASKRVAAIIGFGGKKE